MMHRWKLSLAAAAVAASMVPSASAGHFDSVVVFGDSLSDTGNVYGATLGGFPPAPYYIGRFSNGPVAVEYMANYLGLASHLQDYAWGGAVTGSAYSLAGNPAQAPILRPNYINYHYFTTTPALPNMSDELGMYLGATGGHANPNALYVVWGGPNDIFLAQEEGRLSSLADAPAVLGEAVANVTRIAGSLVTAGAAHVFVPGMGDLGLTPEFAGNPAVGSAMAASFNASLQLALASNLPAGTWQYFDTFGLQDAIAANPSVYGFDNVTDACISSAGCTNPAKYLFWDSVHPTTAGHQVLGLAFANAVPEPETYAMMLAGLAVLGALVRRRAATAQ